MFQVLCHITNETNISYNVQHKCVKYSVTSQMSQMFCTVHNINVSSTLSITNASSTISCHLCVKYSDTSQMNQFFLYHITNESKYSVTSLRIQVGLLCNISNKISTCHITNESNVSRTGPSPLTPREEP